MTATPSNDHSAAAAFLRGIERRAAVLAELQCGDPMAGDRALAVTMALFRNQAAAAGFSAWPRVFWSTLLAQPAMANPGSTGSWEPPFAGLAELQPTPRAALLLRLAAGLQEESAADALGVSLGGYQEALTRGCPRGADGDVDPVAWAMLGRGAQDAVRALPAVRLQRIAALRDSALSGRLGEHPARPDTTPNTTQQLSAVPAPVRTAQPSQPPARTAPRDAIGTSGTAVADADPPSSSAKRLMWTAAAIATGALALWLVWPHLPSYRTPGSDEQVLVEALPAAAKPRARFDAELGLVTEPDLDLLLEAPDTALLDRMDFYAWYAAERDGLLPVRLQPPEDRPARRAQEPTAIDEASESDDAP